MKQGARKRGGRLRKTAEERLQYYASQFPLVEIDATYYALPVARVAEL